MLKRTVEECSKCPHHKGFKEEIGMIFATCWYGEYNTYKGNYKIMDGYINCPQAITESLKK